MNAVVEKTVSPLAEVRLTIERMDEQFRAALPAHIPVERFKRVVMTAIQNAPDLLRCDRKSLFNAAMKAAQDGLLPDGREGAMVVRSDNRSPTGKAASWQPMIAGIRKKARNSGEIATWDAHVVRENDNFEFTLGDAPQVKHSYDLKTERGKIVGAYSVCLLKDGTKSYEVMSIGEIHEIRDRSDAWRAFKAGKIKSTPWSTDEGEMCRKTVARRHSKVLPMSSDLDDLLRRDDELYAMGDAGDAAVKGRPLSMGERFDVLADGKAGASTISDQRGDDVEDIDPDTGEIIDGDEVRSETTAETEAETRPAETKKKAEPAKTAAKAEPAKAKADTSPPKGEVREEPARATEPVVPEDPRAAEFKEALDAQFGKAAPVQQAEPERAQPAAAAAAQAAAPPVDPNDVDAESEVADLLERLDHTPHGIDQDDPVQLRAYLDGIAAREEGVPKKLLPTMVRSQGDDAVIAWRLGWDYAHGLASGG